MSNEMVERVARAMCADLGYEWAGQGMLRPEDYLSMAEAAIAAMREPTEVMLTEGTESIATGWSDGGMDDETAALAWRAMIDAALNEPGSE